MLLSLGRLTQASKITWLQLDFVCKDVQPLVLSNEGMCHLVNAE